MVVRDVQHRRSQPRGMKQVKVEVKEEPDDVKPSMIPAGYDVPPALQDEVRDSEFPDMARALVASVAELENDSPPDSWRPSSAR